MRIVKAMVSAGCKHGSGGYYEINIWYSDTDLKSNGIIKNIELIPCVMRQVSNVDMGLQRLKNFLIRIQVENG